MDSKIEWKSNININDGFDIVIGNPPYVQIQKFSGQKTQKDWEAQKFETFAKTGDVYCLFYERGNNLLKEKGFLCFVTSNKWMRAGYGEATRKYFADKTNPILLLDFGGYKVFESATVDTNILIFQKEKNQNKTIACAIQKDFKINTNISEYLAKKNVILDDVSSESWIILSKEEYDIKKQIEKIGIPLKNWDISINCGIKTGFNEAFIINGKTKEELIQADPKNAEIIKPVLRGRDIRKYFCNFADLWVIFIPWHFPLHDNISIQGNSFKAEEELKKQYSSIYNHLLSYKKELSARNKAETGIRYEWYVLQRFAPTYYQEFNKEKIMFSEIVSEPQFYYDTKGYYPEATGFIITGKSLKYLNALLNSKPVTYFFSKFYAGGGLGTEGFRYKKAFLIKLPIPKISLEEQKPFIYLVDKIIERKKFGENTQELEDQIDQMVYKLYELTQEEIDIVERKIMNNE